MEKIDSSEEDLSGIFFKNIEFKKCDFNKTCFDKSVFEKVSFDKSTFDRAKFMHAIFKQTVFMQSNLIESNFYQSCSEGLSFLNSNIEKTSFNNSKHRNFFIKEGLLEGACFLHAKVEKSEIQKCDLKNVLLADAKKGFVFKQCSENVFTKPVVALTWEFNSSGTFTPLIKKALEEQGALVMPFEYFPEDIDLQRLNEEMKQRIIELKALDEKMFFSRADEIVSQIKKGSEFQKILEKSQSVINHADALFLAGGDDVERVFYTKDTPLDFSDYRRTLLECMLLEQAREESKQVFGTCRGAQVTNVYYGGTIKTVGWQEGIKEFGYSAPPEYVTKVQKMIDHESL